MSRTSRVVLVALFMLVSACGSSDSPSNEATGPTSAGTGTTEAVSETTSTSRPAPPPGTIEIVDFTFAPRDLTVTRGESITWRNEDPYAHWVVSTTPDVLDSGELSQAQTYLKTFLQAGSYDYYCKIHNYMKASVTIQ